MKRIKQWMPVLLTACLLLGALSGCAQKPGSPASQPESQPTDSPSSTGGGSPEADVPELTGELSGKLVVWVGDSLPGYFETIAEEFEAGTGMTVEFVTYAGTSAADKLALDGPAGNGGDVYIQGGGGSLCKAVAQGLFLELPEALLDLDAFTESSVNDYYVDGKLYGLPMGVETPALMYNKDLLPEVPETWDELMEVCGAMADFDNDKYGFLMDATNPYFTNALFSAYGGYFFGQDENGVYDPTDIGLNTEGVAEVFSMFKSYYEKGWWQQGSTFDVLEKKFAEGKAPAIYDGPWAVSNYVEAGINVGVAPLPKLPNGEYPITFSGGYGVAVSEFTKNQKASVEFLKYCTNEKSIMEYYRRTSRIPPLKACLELDEVKNDPIMNGFAEQIQYSMPQPNIPETDMIWTPFMDAAKLIIDQNQDITTTLELAVKNIKEQIAVMGQ